MTTSYALEYKQHGAKEIYESPLREYSLIVTGEGYYPNRLFAFEGEKIRFYITSTNNNPSCFSIPDKDIFLAVEKGYVTEKIVYFQKAGLYEFYCPTGNISGKIRVMRKKGKDEEDAVKRELASKNVKIWMPKDD